MTWVAFIELLMKIGFPAWLGKRLGASEQRAEDAQAVVAKQAEVSDAMRQVDATTTHSDADVDKRLRDGTF